MKKLILKAFAALVLVALVVLAGSWLPLGDWLDALSARLAGLGWFGGCLYASALTAAAMLGLPCSPFTIGAGALFGPWWGWVVVEIGTLASAAGGFLVTRHLARRRFVERLRHSPKFALIDAAIAREGWKIVTLLRMCPIPFGLSNYLYGLSGVGFWHYMIATFFGMAGGNAVFVYLGAVGRRSLSGEARTPHPLEYAALALAFIAFMVAGTYIARLVRRVTREDAAVE